MPPVILFFGIAIVGVVVLKLFGKKLGFKEEAAVTLGNVEQTFTVHTQLPRPAQLIINLPAQAIFKSIEVDGKPVIQDGVVVVPEPVVGQAGTRYATVTLTKPRGKVVVTLYAGRSKIGAAIYQAGLDSPEMQEFMKGLVRQPVITINYDNVGSGTDIS